MSRNERQLGWAKQHIYTATALDPYLGLCIIGLRGNGVKWRCRADYPNGEVTNRHSA